MNCKKEYCLKYLALTILIVLISFVNTSPLFAQEEDISFREYIFGINQEDSKVTFYPKFIKVIRGDEVRIYTTRSATPDGALEESGYILTNDSKIWTYDDEFLPNLGVIQVIKLRTELEIREVEIPYSRKTHESWKYPLGEQVVEQKGVKGLKEQRIQSYYEDGFLVKEDILSEDVISEPKDEIVAIGSSTYTLEGITERSYDCKHWYGVVDSGDYTAKEKQWLKFVMYCESGCNAESNKSFYKGLFQWSPTLWKKLYPENIFDGNAQIKHTVEKLRQGADPLRMWPGCARKYESKYGPF